MFAQERTLGSGYIIRMIKNSFYYVPDMWNKTKLRVQNDARTEHVVLLRVSLSEPQGRQLKPLFSPG